MSYFLDCYSQGCNKYAEVVCKCSRNFVFSCRDHFWDHESISGSREHKHEQLYMPIHREEKQILLNSLSEIDKSLKTQISDIFNEYNERISSLISQMKNIETERTNRLRSTCNLHNSLKNALTNIAYNEKWPLYSNLEPIKTLLAKRNPVITFSDINETFNSLGILTFHDKLPKVLRTIEFQGHSEYIYSLSFSPCGRYLASCSRDQTIKIWNLANNQSQTYKTAHSSLFLEYSSCGNYLYFTEKYSLFSIDIKKDKKKLIKVHQSLLGKVSVSKTYVIYGRRDGIIQVFNLRQRSFHELIGHRDGVLVAKVSSQEEVIVSGGIDSTIQVWSTDNWGITNTLEIPSRVYDLDLSPYGEWVAYCCSELCVYLWNLYTGASKSIPVHAKRIYTIRFSPCSNWVFSGGKDKRLCVWNSNTEESDTIYTQESEIFALAVDKSGQKMALGTINGSVSLLTI